ncbi:hypothetical protein U8V72_24720 [Priestia filamentosa]|uniref:hypothetical protein n=1 Tax=Priestia filamentosa TaxID=1402861 RepID=UPI0005891785
MGKKKKTDYYLKGTKQNQKKERLVILRTIKDFFALSLEVSELVVKGLFGLVCIILRLSKEIIQSKQASFRVVKKL